MIFYNRYSHEIAHYNELSPVCYGISPLIFIGWLVNQDHVIGHHPSDCPHVWAVCIKYAVLCEE